MLTADLVRARRSGNSLVVQRFRGDDRARAEGYAAEIIEVLARHEGETRADAEGALPEIARDSRDEKLFDGLAKLAFDRCTFEGGSHEDAEGWRASLFLAAAKARREAPEAFSRARFLESHAALEGVPVEQIMHRLWSDLPGRDRLVHVAHILPEVLVDAYILAQYQAVLFRARELRVVVEAPSPVDLRRFLRSLKFHRLLFSCKLHTPFVTEEAIPAKKPRKGRVAASADGEKPRALAITIDGPLSMFSASTKYGLALAIAAGQLPGLGRFAVEADLLWGKERRVIQFTFGDEDLPTRLTEREAPPSLTEGQQLAHTWNERKSPWRVQNADEVLIADGGAVVVPDLIFTRAEADGSETRVAVEVLGFWSREAIFQRLEISSAGLGPQDGKRIPILFCASERLRVSEKVAEAEPGVGLYVFKGAVRVTQLELHLDALRERWRCTGNAARKGHDAAPGPQTQSSVRDFRHAADDVVDGRATVTDLQSTTRIQSAKVAKTQRRKLASDTTQSANAPPTKAPPSEGDTGPDVKDGPRPKRRSPAK